MVLKAWSLILRDPWALPAFIALIPFATYAITTIQFYYTLFVNKKRKCSHRVVPVVPYWIPYLGHAIPMAIDSASFVSELMRRFGTGSPISIRVGPKTFTVVANPEHIQTLFKKSRMLSNKSVTVFVLDYLLGASKKIISFYKADNSGMAAKAHAESKVKQEDRVFYFQIRTAHKYLSGQHLHSLNDRFLATLDRDLEAKGIGQEWIEYPDLYKFLQATVTRSSIETIFGRALLELNPTFIEDFWQFEASAPQFLHGMPRCLIPKAYSARDRLIKAFMKIHAYANSRSDCSKTGTEDAEWEPIFGSKLIRTRQEHMLKMGPMDDEARACEDLGLMFGLNANVLPCIYWYIVEAMRRPDLLTRLLADVEKSTLGEAGKVDIQKLGSQPLTQSMLAETLRLYIAIFTLRHGDLGPVQFGGYELKTEDLAIIYSRTGALDAEAWAQSGRRSDIPLEQFDAERFLIDGDSLAIDDQGSDYRAGGRKFSMDGLAGVWLPFGGGDRMCPGRHYAKTEMMGTLAVLFNKFDVELLMEDTSKVQPNLGFAPFGSLPPTCELPFRMRRKVPRDST
ncbi:cytochrome P450 [Diaporthe sp. PMI_573]|nr:cytochrome P450 [Diaporthaceae sp. PMI_573]